MRKIILSTRIKPVLLIALCTALLILCVSFGVLTANTRSASGAELESVPDSTTKIEVTYSGGITSAMTYAEMKNRVTVTAYDDGGSELGTLSADAFELVGDFSSGNTTSNFKAVVTTPRGEISSASFTIDGFTVTDTTVRSISAEYTGTGLRSGSTIALKDIKVTAIRWDGNPVSSVSTNDFTISGVLTPDSPDTVGTYDKEITVTWSSDSKITCTCLITGISARAPIGLAGTLVEDTVLANAEYKSGDIEVVVVYSGFQPYSLDSGAYTVQYMRLSDDGTWVVDRDATGYIYENGGIGKVLVTYTEAETSVTAEVDLYVSKVPVDAPVFTTKESEYQYTVEDETVTGQSQTITLNDNYDSKIMTMTGVTYAPNDGQTEYTPSFNPVAGTITVQDAGTYTATIKLNEGTDAYYFRDPKDSGNETIRSVEITFTVTRAPLEDLKVEFIKDGEPVTQWNRDDVVEAKLSGNYGNGSVTYKYKNKDTGAESDTLPNETGTYELTVKVSGTNNFAAGEYKTEGEIEFTIGQRSISAPRSITSLTYNGTLQEPEISYDRNNDKDYLDVTNNGGTNAEYEYSVTFKIKDTNQAKWADDVVASVPDGATRAELNESKDTLTLYYKIGKLSIAVPTFGTDGEEVTTEYQGAPNSGTSQTQFLSGYKPSEGLSIDSPVTVTVTSDVTSGATADSATGKITATNAGTYTITVKLGDTVNLQWADGKIDDLEFIWIIEKATVTVPDAGSKPYTGSALKSDLADTSEYTVTQSDDWTNVGSNYNVTLTLRDKNNYKWSTTGVSDDVTVQFAITQAANSFTLQPSIIGWTYNQYSEDVNKPSGAAAKFGTDTIVYKYSASEDGEYTETVPTEAGTYYVKAFIAATDNYVGAVSSAVEFTIAKAQLTRPTADSTEFTYNGTKQTYTPDADFDPDTMTISGNEQTNANETGYTVTVSITNTNNYEWSTGNKQDDITFKFIIKKATLTVTATKTEEAYSGNSFVPEYTLSGWYVDDEANGGYTFSWTVTGDKVTDGEAVNAGTYSGTLEIERTSGTVNYKLTDNTVQFKITQAANSFTSQPVIKGWTYGDVAKEPSGAAAEFGTDTIVYKYSAKADGEYTETVPTEAGTYYVKAFIAATDNYAGAESDAVEFTIAKAEIDISTIVSEPENISGNEASDDRRIPFTEDGTSHLIVTENPDRYSIGDFSSDNNVGSYEVILTLVDPDNYEWTGYIEAGAGVVIYDTVYGGEITIRYAITYQQFTLGIELADTWDYGNDANNAPDVTNNLTGNTATFTYYTWDEDAQRFDEEGSSTLPTNVGRYLVVAEVDDGNNYAGTEARKEFTITPRTVTVKISVSDGTYGSWSGASIADISGYAGSGYEQIEKTNISLIFESLTSGVELVNGIPQNAGEYSVTAQFATGANPNGNYTLAVAYTTDGAFTISPLVLTVTGWDGTTNVYAGQGSSYQPTVNGANVQEKFGDTLKGLALEYTVTANEGSSLTDAAAVDVGSYTVKVTGIGNKNYTLDGATDIEQSFTITPYTIAFTITPQDTVYGSFMGNANIRIDYTTTTIGGESAKLSFSYEGRLNSGSSYTGRFEAGSYTVTATIGNENYQLAGGVTAQEQDFTIERYTITEVTWETYDDLTYRNADLYAEKNGVFASAAGVYDDGTLDLTEAITQNEIKATFKNAGSYTFTAGLGLSGTQAYNYKLGSTFTEDYTIEAAQISIDIVEKSATYRGTSYTADEVFTGGLGNSYTVSGSTFSVDLNKAVSFAIAENMNAGSYAVTLTFTDPNFTVSGWSGEAGDQSYTFANAFTIDPALLTPSFTTDGGVYGNIDATVAAGNGWSVEGLVNGEQQDVLGGSISYAGVDTSDIWSGASSPAGSYTITLTITNGNYTFQEGSSVLTFTADEHLVVEQHTITQVTWAKYSEDQLTYTGSDLYEALGEAFASAQGVNGDGTLQLGESIALASGGSADFINAGSYTFTATLGIWGDNYKFPEDTSFTQTYIIVNADIIVSGVEGYADDYDGNAHDALVDGYTAKTADGSEANWSFYVGATAPEADSEAWGAMPEFTNAGTYTVWYKASAENHNDVITSVTVTIDKLAISVAIDGTITYGDALPAYTVGVDNDGAYTSRLTSGSYAGSENFATLLSTGLTLTGISSDDYLQGDGIDTYNLTWTFSDEATNYIVTAVAGDLTVNRRAVTIKINDYTDGIYGQPPTAGQLTWERTAGSIYDDDVLFTLATTATASSDITTAERHYYIYPVLEEVADNYSITFTGSLTYTGNGYDGAAGEYVIHPAEVSIDISAPVEGLTYDGKAKEYSATSGNTTLTPVYYEYIGDEADWETNKSDLSYFEEISSAPVEAGYYRVQFTSNNPNYTSGSSGTSFRIEPRTINVEIDIASGSYTGQQFVAEITFGNVVADDLEAWQAGTDYTVTYTGRNTTVYDSQTAPVNVGSYTVTVAVLDGNYELTQIGSVSDFEITRAQLMITAENKTIVYGDALNSVTFTVNYSGFVNGETAAVLGGTLAFTTANKVGGAPYEQGDDAGSTYRIIPKGLTSDNYDIEFKEGALSVEERGVTVTIKDQTTTYTGVTAVLDQDAYEATNVYGGDDLGIALSTDGVNAGDYAITASWSNNNYDVTFAGSWSGNQWGTLTIDPAPLTITAENKTIIYGDALTSVAFSVSYSGLVNDEQADEVLGGTLAFATANTAGGAAYAQGDAAGSTYTIRASGLTSGNYTIEWLTGTLTVEKRVVTVEVDVGGDGQYAYGAAVAADVTFRNVYGVDSVAHKVYYQGTPNGGLNFDWTESVPTLAGEYLARVQITDSNYTFANDNAYSEDFSYNIAKRLLDVNWNELTIQYDSAVNEHSNYLVFTGFDGYSGDVDGLIAGVLSVGTQTAVGADAIIVQQATSQNGYVIRVNGAVATYTVVVTISGSNFDNYAFAEGSETTVSFEVSASVNTLEFAQDVELGWTYGEPAAWTEGTGLNDILSLTYGDVTQVIFSYAVRTENGTATGAVYTSVRPDDAGDYWVRAFYPGDVGQGFGSAVAYAEFTIAQATLQAPSLTHSETTYSGLEQDNAIVGFDAVTMGISTDVNFSTEGEGDGYTVVLHATDAGSYTVTITLKDSRNYVWADGSSSVLKWTVNAATGNRVTIPDGGPWTYGETITAPQATATFGEPTYQYAVLSEDFSGTDYSGVTGWASGFPTQAGRYVVRAIVRATSNYDGAVAYKEFRINPAQITVGDDVAGYTGTYDGTSHNARTAGTASTVDNSAVTWSYSLTGADGSWQTRQFAFRNATDGAVTVYYKVSASNHEDAYGQFTVSIAKANLTVIVGSANITYGETAPASYTLSYAGFVGSDTSSVVDASEAVFSCSYATGDDAGDYAVSVSGLTADNYTFNVIDGTLNVGRKPIAVGIGDQFSDYGETVVLDQTQWACNEQELIDGDTLDDLGITLTTQAGQPSYTSAGTYAITGSAAAGNYEVSFIPGIYTIYARSLTVEITANGGIYGGTITGATAVLMENGQPVSYGDVSVILTYTGTANDGTSYDSTVAPTKAGVYTVTATLNSDNYTLTGVTTAAFIVERATVTVPDAGSKTYTGSTLKSDLADTSEYTVTQGDNWTAAGNYNVTLTLKDKNNYKWSTTNASDDVTVTFTINQAENEFTARPVIEGWTYSEDANAPGGAEALFGTETIVYMYSAAADGEYTTTVPTEAGTYYVKAFIAATNNYAGAESDAVMFTIAKYTNNAISGLTFESSWVYNTTPTAPSASAAFGTVQYKYAVDDGSTPAEDIAEWSDVMPTAAGSYWICAYVDGTVNYNGAAEYKQFTITPATLTVTGVAGYSGTYDGTAHSGRTGGTVSTVDGSAATWQYSLTGSGDWQTAQFTFTNAGTYTVYYKVTAANHSDVTGEFTVNIYKASLIVIVGNDTVNYGEDAPSTFEVTYNGFVGTDSESDLGGALVFDVNGYSAGSDAGTYTVKASGLTSDNYVITYTDGTLQVVKINATVTITPNGGVYGGTITGATATVDGLIAADEGSVNAVLTYTGTAYDGTQYNGTEVPTKAGAYTVTATLDSANYTLTGVTTAAFIVERATVTVPDAGSKPFAGSALKSDLADTSEYTVTQGEDWTNAGNYNVTLTLRDKNNYKWSTTGASDDVTVIFAITQAANSFTARPVIEGWTYSEDANKPYGAAAHFGTDTIVYMYSAEEYGEYTTNVPTEAGTYYVKAFIAATDNYAGAESDAVEFTIAKYTSNAISGLTFADSWVYGRIPNGPTASATFGTVQYKYAADDGSTLPEDIAVWSTAIPKSVGDYWICAYVDGTDNYNGAAEYKQFTITPATITVTGVAGYTGTYDGTAHGARTGGTASTVDGIIATWQYSLTGSGNWQTDQLTFTDAGTYTVHYKVTAANHNEVTGSFNVNINKASLTVIVGNATINYGEDAPGTFEVTYNGFVGTDSESDLGGAIKFSVKDYVPGAPANSYIVSASGLTSDNYDITYRNGILFVTSITITATITPNGGVYGGTIIGATATLNGVPAGADIEPILTYTGTAYDGTIYNSTEVPTKAGSYTVTVSLSDDSYTLSGVTSSIFTIERATVTVPDAGSKTYTGSALKSDLTDTSEYTVTQGEDWTNAGNYNVTLTLRDKNNYKWSTTGAGSDVTVTFTITQAENKFTAQPVINGWTYSEDANAPGGAEALFGTETIVYMYSAAADGEYTTTVPTEAGTYYVKAFITETSNYTGAESDAVMFEIVIHADAATPELEFETSVYSGAEQTNEITGYDASIMSMTGTAAVSTSDGITVLKATNAGVYTVTITLKNENYTFSDGSRSVTLSWTISRQSVDKPVEAEGEWIIADGNTFEYIPVGFDDDLMKITGNKITEPGNYTVTVTLRDTNNYVWDDGTDDPVVFTWNVAEKEISLLWLIILLIVIIVIEIIVLIAGIVRRRKSDNDGSGDGAGKDNAGFAAAMAFTVMSDVIIPSHLTACCVLGGIAVILLVCVLIVYLKKKKSAEDKQHAKKADPAEANVKAEQNGKDNADKK